LIAAVREGKPFADAEARARIEEMIETFGLAPWLSAAPDSLPLGFKQRLALACAVMHRPPVLFLDEPTSGVDPITRREFWTHINGLARRGVTVMVTTHFMDEAEYCDRIGLVFRGQLIASGTPDELKALTATDASPDPSMEDAFIALIGFHTEHLKFGYSYDVTTSKLTTATAGSHEVSLTLQFDCKKKRRRVRTVPCPTF